MGSWWTWIILAAMRRDLREEQLALAARRRVHDVVHADPGAHLSEVARLAGMEPGHAQYHLERLCRAGLLSEAPGDGFRRFYPRTDGPFAHDLHGRAEKQVLAALRRPTPLRIILALLREEAAVARLAERTGKSASTLVYHLDRLVDAGVVARLGETHMQRRYRLADEALVTALLMRHPPRYDLVSAFIDMFDGLAVPPPTPASSGAQAAEPSP